MKITEFEQKIQTAQQTNIELTTQLNGFRVQIVETAKEYIGDYMKQQFESQINMKPERTKELHEKHQLEVFKTEFLRTIENASQCVESQLDNIHCWIHLSAFSEMSNNFERKQRYEWINTTQETLITLFQEMLGSIGQLLLKYGYISKEARPWLWRDGQIVAYDSRPTLGQKLEDLMSQQKDALEQFIDSQQQLSRLHIQKKQTEARQLWEEVK